MRWFYSVTLAFILCGSVAIATENFWFVGVPAAMAVLYLSIYAIDVLLYIVVFCTPLAVTLDNKSFGFALSLPTEPLLFGIMLLFLFKVLKEGGW